MNLFKKITTIIAFTFVFLFGTNESALAAAQWNTHPGDLSTMASKINGTSTYGAVTNATPGQVIAVRIYYHNTGVGAANNTTFYMSSPSGSKTSHTITGTVGSTGAGSKSGSTTINLSSAQTLTYVPGSLRFYRYNQNSTATPVSNPDAIFSSGLTVGTIPGMETCPVTNDFCEQGSVAVAFQVGNQAPTTYLCSNGIDDDQDGLVDYPSDPGCTSSTDNNEYNAVVVNPTVCTIDSFYASPSTVNSGSSVSLYWNTTNCNTVTIDGVQYSADGSGTFGPLYSGRTYTIAANNGVQYPTQNQYVGVTTVVNPTVYACNDGIDNDGDGYVDMNDAGCGYSTDGDEYNYVAPINANPTITTLNPSSLTSTSGRLNGTVVNAGSSSTTLYFEWGTDSGNLYNKTDNQTTNSNGTVTYFDTLRNLSTGTTYYYRAVSKTSNSTVYRGDIKSFRLVAGTVSAPTTGNTTVVTRPSTTTTVVTQAVAPTQDRGIVVGVGTNMVQLRYTNNNQFSANNGSFNNSTQVNNGVQNVCVDDTTKFVVEYKNISTTVLSNAILHIDIPKDVEFKSSSAGVYNKADNTITVNVGTLNPDQIGTVSFDGLVLSSAANRDLLVVPATLSFENPNNGARETAVAYGLATSQNCARNTNLAGFALGSGFFPSTLFGWLLLALALTALVYLIRRWMMLAPVARYGGRRVVAEKHYEDMDIPTAPYRH